jgi:hypothetical protein
MSTPPAPQRVPTLTEVVPDIPAAPVSPVPPHVEADILPEPTPAGAPVDEAQIAEQVLASLLPRIDGLFEHRLRDALAPRIARVQATLVDEMRLELAAALREVVAQAVADQVARHRRG